MENSPLTVLPALVASPISDSTSKHDVSFSQKTTMLFRPDQSGIGRLVNRGKSGSNKAMVSVESDTAKIGMTFSTKTRKWDAEINSEEKWEKQTVAHLT